MNKAQTAGVDLAKIAVRKLPLHHPQRTLAESAIVGGNPTSADVHADINSRDCQNCKQDRCANDPTLRRLGATDFMCTARFREPRIFFPNEYFHVQGRINLCVRIQGSLFCFLLHFASKAVKRSFASLLSWFSSNAR